MLEAVKTALGIKSNAYDAVLKGSIASAVADLRLVGVVNLEDTDPLIITAVSSYAQAYLPGTDADKRNAFLEIYKNQKHNQSMASEYTEVAQE